MLRALFRLALLGSLMTLGASGVAWAHVEISPSEVPVGGEQGFVAEAPNESDVPFTKLEIRVPDGFEVTSVDSPDGFQGRAEGNSIVWSGGSVPVGESEEFPFEARAPEQECEFPFEALQTYEDGEVVRWVGPEDSNEPAPVVSVSSTGGASGEADETQHGDEEHGEHSRARAEVVPSTGGAPLGAVAISLGAALLVSGLLLRARHGA